MEKQDQYRREAAQKVKDYHTFHLSGDLSHQLVGQVAHGICQFESPGKTSDISFGGSPLPAYTQITCADKHVEQEQVTHLSDNAHYIM